MRCACCSSATLDRAVATLNAANINVVASSGNFASDACMRSPARAPGALAVGAADIANARAGFSSYGGGVALHAPGVDVATIGSASDVALETWSGTSPRLSRSAIVISTAFACTLLTMCDLGTSYAAPHVAGALAALRALFPHLNATASSDALTCLATLDALTNLPNGTPNRMLRAGSLFYNPSGDPNDEADRRRCGLVAVTPASPRAPPTVPTLLPPLLPPPLYDVPPPVTPLPSPSPTPPPSPPPSLQPPSPPSLQLSPPPAAVTQCTVPEGTLPVCLLDSSQVRRACACQYAWSVGCPSPTSVSIFCK